MSYFRIYYEATFHPFECVSETMETITQVILQWIVKDYTVLCNKLRANAWVKSNVYGRVKVIRGSILF